MQDPSASPAGTDTAYARVWFRFQAMSGDLMLLFLGYLAIAFILGFVSGFVEGLAGRSFIATSQTTGVAIAMALTFILSAVYFSINWGAGATPSMRRFGLRVVDADGRGPIGPGRALVRWLVWILSAAAVGVGLIWVAFDARKQGWHDKIANTVVIQL